MNRDFKKIAMRHIIAIAIILLLVECVSSQVPPVLETPWTRVVGGVLNKGLELLERRWIASTVDTLHEFFMSIFDNLRMLIEQNPSIEKIRILMAFFIRIVEPFYALAIILTGGYVILLSPSPENRARAKFLLGKLIIGMVLISLSPFIVELMLYLSSALATTIMNLAPTETAIDALRTGPDEMHAEFGDLIWFVPYGGVDLMGMTFGLSLILYLFLIFRYMMVGLLGALFPVTIFLYSFRLTQEIGRRFLNQTFLWYLMSSAWAIALVVIGLAVNTIHNVDPSFPEFYLMLAAILFLYTVPVMLLGMMNWLGIAFYFVGGVTGMPAGPATAVVAETVKEKGRIEEKEVVIKPSWGED